MNDFLFKKISEYFSGKEINKAYIFGSFVRGEENDSSDIDILIELSESIGYMKLIKYKYELEDLLHRNVDLVTKAALSPKIYNIIQHDWKLIYDRAR
jgi:predicted nucleotidyltransferase